MNTASDTTTIYKHALAGLATLVTDKRLEELLATITNIAEARKLTPVGFSNGWYSQARDGFTLLVTDSTGEVDEVEVSLRRWLGGWAGCCVTDHRAAEARHYACINGEFINL